MIALKIRDLAVTLILDQQQRLQEVRLPRQVPDSLDRDTLLELNTALAAYVLAPDAGGDFARRVRAHLRQIPWGSASTYGEIAAALGNPKAVRAVGQACATNPLLIAIPCHRVVAQAGIGNYALGAAWKQKLLELESE